MLCYVYLEREKDLRSKETPLLLLSAVVAVAVGLLSGWYSYYIQYTAVDGGCAFIHSFNHSLPPSVHLSPGDQMVPMSFHAARLTSHTLEYSGFNHFDTEAMISLPLPLFPSVSLLDSFSSSSFCLLSIQACCS